ncbi:unnamed protein product, partial [Pocillopora meandrina]
MIEELQELALDIFLFASSHNIRLDLTWIPRDQNSEADRFSKVVDIDDYSVHDDVFIRLDRLWGPHSIDRFASSYNAKLPRFNSRFLQSGTEAVDAFSQDWSCDNNWIIPPATVVGKVLNYIRKSKAVGTLIVPMWKSSYFWPLLCNDGMHLNSFVKHWLCLPKRPDLFVADVFTTGFWKDLSAVEDESLKGLASRLEATFLASRAPGTTDAYRRSFARWKKFASSKSEFQHFPAKTEHFALYLQHLIDTTHSQSAVDSAIYAIQWAHTMAAIPSPTNSPIIHAIREAAKRLVGTRPVNKKEPISAGMIRKLLRNVCIFILAYAGFFRIQEVLHIKYGDIHFNSGYVVINVDVSKTDQLRKGNEVVISVGSGEKTCPVKILRRYLIEVERYPVQSDHFVFRALSKCKSGHKLVAINRPVSYSTIREYFKVNFKDI